MSDQPRVAIVPTAPKVLAELASAHSQSVEDRLRSGLMMSAFGDAWGYVHEFDEPATITSNRAYIPALLTISDDTQMALETYNATAELIQKYGQDGLPHGEAGDHHIRAIYAKHYMEWSVSPWNDRAPGITVMSSLEEIREGTRASGSPAENGSRGSGTVMRTPILAMFPFSPADMYRLGYLSSQVTHGDELGNALAGWLPVLVRELARYPHDTDDFMTVLLDTVKATQAPQRLQDQLRSLIETTFTASTMALTPVSDELRATTGWQGWIADEAVRLALLLFHWAVAGVSDGVTFQVDDKKPAGLTVGDDYREMVKRLLPAVVLSGDSDTVATIAGWLIGTTMGMSSATRDSILGRLEPKYQQSLSDILD